MKIGIIGSGNVARSLGAGLAAVGHNVMLGSREPSKSELQEWLQQNDDLGRVGSIMETAEFGEIIILAVAGHAVAEVLAPIKAKLAQKVVIDVTNPLTFEPGASPELSVGHTTSGGEITQECLPNSLVVKTLNTINFAHMVQPKYQQGTPVMFLCGNDSKSKKSVTKLLSELGCQNIVDLGGIEKSRLTEPLCLLWVNYGIINGTWDHAFAVINC